MPLWISSNAPEIVLASAIIVFVALMLWLVGSDR